MAENRRNKVGFQQDFTGATNTSGNGSAGGRGGDIASYNRITTNFIVHDRGDKKVLEPLSQHIAPGALHNAAERFDAPKCHPQTREAIIREIIEWTEQDGDKHPFLWVYGPAGTGKSSIAQSIAEMLFKEGKVAASFFFSRTATGRNDASRFIATLAYQLALNIPKMDEIVAKAVDHDPAIFSKSLDTQMEALIMEPLDQLSRSATVKDNSWQPLPKLVIIDGLDECGNSETQRLLLTGLLTAVQKLPFQLCFMIASRPEYHIRSFFNDSSVHSISRSLVLDDRYEPDKDIAHFLRSRFSDIKRNHPSGQFLPSDWPSDSDIDRLVQKASGQFIYASTVMKFVESPRRLPVDQLNIILGLSPPGKNTPFADLDFLYIYVFESVDDGHTEKVMMVFVFLLLKGVDVEAESSRIEAFLCLQQGELHTLLIDLHSVIHIPEVGRTSEVLRLHHASLGDFLLDRTRSGRFYIDMGQGHVQMAKYCMKHLVPQSKSFSDAGRKVAYINLEYHCRNALPVQELLEDLHGVDFEAYLDVGVAYVPAMGLRPKFLDRVITQFLAWIRDVEAKYGSEEKVNGLYAKYLAQFDRNVQARLARYPLGPMAPYLATTSTLKLTKPAPNVIFRNLVFGLQPPVHSLFDYQMADTEACHYNSNVRIKGFHDLVIEVLEDGNRSGAYHVNSRSYRNLAHFCITVLNFSWFRNEKPILPGDIKEVKKFKLKEFEKFYFDLLLSILAANPLDPELAKYLWDNPIPKDSMHVRGKERTETLLVIQSYIEECDKNSSNHNLSSSQESLITPWVEENISDATPLPFAPEELPTTVVQDNLLSLSNQTTSIYPQGSSPAPSDEPTTIISEEAATSEKKDETAETPMRLGKQVKETPEVRQNLGEDLNRKMRNLQDFERRLGDLEAKLVEREDAVNQKEKEVEKLANNMHTSSISGPSVPPADYDTFEFATSVAWPGAVTTILRGQAGLGKAIKKKHQTIMDDWVKSRGDDLHPDSYDYLLYSHGVAWPKAILDFTTEANFSLIHTKFQNTMLTEGYQF